MCTSTAAECKGWKGVVEEEEIEVEEKEDEDE